MTDFNSATALADLAGELDDDNDPAGDDAGADPIVPADYYVGRVESGPDPYPGQLLASRYPAGVLLIDKPTDRAWVLDRDAAGGIYRCRNITGVPVDPDGRWRAAEGADWDVRAYDSDFDGDDPAECDDPNGCATDAGGTAE